MRIQYNAVWLLYLSSFAFAGPVNDNHIQEKDGYYYLQKGYTDKDAAEFYWRSLEGWSEVPDNVARYFTKTAGLNYLMHRFMIFRIYFLQHPVVVIISPVIFQI